MLMGLSWPWMNLFGVFWFLFCFYWLCIKCDLPDKDQIFLVSFSFYVNCVIFKYFIIGVEKWRSVESASTLLCTYEDLSLNPRFRVKWGGVTHICHTSASVGNGRRRQENPWSLVEQLAGRKQWTTHQRPSLERGRRQEPTPEVDLWPLTWCPDIHIPILTHMQAHTHTST